MSQTLPTKEHTEIALVLSPDKNTKVQIHESAFADAKKNRVYYDGKWFARKDKWEGVPRYEVEPGQ